MIKPVFFDTSALIAIGNKHDAFHLDAVRIRNDLKKTKRYFVTTSAILYEFGSAFSSINLRLTAIKMIEAIIQSKKWNCIQIDNELFNKGFELYKQVKDKEWGLVDCTSIIVSRNMGIIEVFTADHHFEQAGFTILLKPAEQKK